VAAVTSPQRRIALASRLGRLALLAFVLGAPLGVTLGVVGAATPVATAGSAAPTRTVASSGPTAPPRAPKTTGAQDSRFLTDVAEADPALASYEQKQQNVALRALLTD
jgi:hypothetical protein